MENNLQNNFLFFQIKVRKTKTKKSDENLQV